MTPQRISSLKEQLCSGSLQEIELLRAVLESLLSVVENTDEIDLNTENIEVSVPDNSLESWDAVITYHDAGKTNINTIVYSKTGEANRTKTFNYDGADDPVATANLSSIGWTWS